MSDIENEPPRGHVKMVYMGPIAPHWDMRSDFGDKEMIDSFRTRIQARLVLLPPHDPQFRRNRERVNRDAERENILIEWDLGYEEEEAEQQKAKEAAAAARWERARRECM